MKGMRRNAQQRHRRHNCPRDCEYSEVVVQHSCHGVCAPLSEQWVNTEFENEVLYHTLPGGHDYLANRIVEKL